jgi:penicillin-binding protein 2
MSARSRPRRPASTRRRLYALAAFFAVMLAVDAARLYSLQIAQYSLYASQSRSNHLREQIIPAVRGEIYTSNGVVLATNRLVYRLVYRGGKVWGWRRIRYMAGLGKIPLPKVPAGGSVTLSQHLPSKSVAGLEELTVDQPNLRVVRSMERYYPQGHLAGNLVGYTSLATAHEVKSEKYNPNDQVGRTGVEASMQKVLAGQDGLRLIEVNAAGVHLSSRVANPGRAGESVTLTINSKLQRVAEQALKDSLNQINFGPEGRKAMGLKLAKVVKGAVIAIDPRNNHVLAMATWPDINPNWFTEQPRPKQLVEALTGQSGALQDRAVQPYNSGSVFKIAVADALLRHIGNPTFDCAPFITFGGIVFHNWYAGNMGPMQAQQALANSCDTWFYQAAIAANPVPFSNELVHRARALGFGRRTGIQLVGEPVGQLQDAQTYQKQGLIWYPGMTVNMSIGQGNLTITPAELIRALSTIVENGKQRPLDLIKAIGGHPVPTKPAVQIPDAPQNWKIIQQGLALTTTKGTSDFLFGPTYFPVPTAGKTGTAQTSHAASNAWYEGYGPVGNPNFMVVVFLDRGMQGSYQAAPVARRIMAAYWGIRLAANGTALSGPTEHLPKSLAAQLEKNNGPFYPPYGVIPTKPLP